MRPSILTTHHTLTQNSEEDEGLPEVFPPFLPPKAVDSPPYTLVLDLDETLIHFEENDSEAEDGEVFYLIRPGLNKFLTQLYPYFEIVIYTAALEDYANWILN